MTINWRQVLADQLVDRAFRDRWERTAVARALAIWLCKYRAEHGLTQAALADRVGMKQSAIARLEVGETEPRLSTLLRLSRALGTPVELMVEGTADPSRAERIVVGAPVEPVA